MAGEEVRATPLGAGGNRVWLLPRGSRGDVQPYVALALGLQRAGFDVRVFAAGLYEKLFTVYGVPFERTDVCAFWRNTEVLSQLHARAVSLHVLGPQECSELLQQRKHEFVTFFGMKGWKDRPPTTTFMAKLNSTEAKYNSLWRGGKDLDFAEWCKWEDERYQEYVQAQAAAKKVDVKDFEPVLCERRKAYMASMAALAEEHGQTLEDFSDLLHEEFHQYISEIFTSSFTTGGQVSGKVVSEYLSFGAWKAEHCNLADYWAEWRSKLPGLDQLWHERAVACNTKCGQLQVWSVVAAAKALPREDLPDIVLHPQAMLSAALELKTQLGLNTLLTTTRPPCLESAAQLMAFAMLLIEETATGLSGLKNMGPVEFSDLLRNPRQLLGIGHNDMPPEAALPQVCKSSLMWLNLFEARLHGQWHLSAEQELQAAAEPCLFGGERALELLKDFLAAGPEPPIYIGFGSTQYPGGPKALARLAVGALKLCDRRGIFFSSWGRMTQAAYAEALSDARHEDRLGDLSSFANRHVLFLRAAPHEWLFPQCDCIVHQPGVGTTEAALRAGVPQVLLEAPGASSSATTRSLVVRLGVGEALEVSGISADSAPRRLAEAVKALLANSAIREAAKEVGAEHRRLAGASASAEDLQLVMREDALRRRLSPEEVAVDMYGRELSENPWFDGMYHLFTPNGAFGGKVEILGNRVFAIGLDVPICWLRALSDTEVEGFFQSSVDVAQLSDDVSDFKWGNGTEFRLRSATMTRSCEKSCECTVA